MARWWFGVVVSCVVAHAAIAADRPHIYLIVVDGLDPRHAVPDRLPVLFDDTVTSGRPVGRSLAAMPTRTNPNHANLLTGVHPDAHGITGNAYWKRGTTGIDKLEAASALEVETLFTAAERHDPKLVTVGVFAKPKLGKLFGPSGDAQTGPDVLWSPDAANAPRDAATGYASDATTMDAVLAAIADREPDLVAVNLADVDRTAHGHGPDAPECIEAVRGADAAIRRLVDDLRRRGRWDRSVVVVTADHGFDTITRSLALTPALAKAGLTGIKAVGDGGVDHVYAEVIDANTPALLARVAAIARAIPGVTEVLARVDVPDVARLGLVHPDWHLDHERTGELLLVATRGLDFVENPERSDMRLPGNHGGPGERLVPLAVLGGWLEGDGSLGTTPTAADVGATLGAWLGLRPVRRVDGGEVPEDRRGQPIAEWLFRGRTAGRSSRTPTARHP